MLKLRHVVFSTTVLLFSLSAHAHPRPNTTIFEHQQKGNAAYFTINSRLAQKATYSRATFRVLGAAARGALLLDLAWDGILVQEMSDKVAQAYSAPFSLCSALPAALACTQLSKPETYTSYYSPLAFIPFGQPQSLTVEVCLAAETCENHKLQTNPRLVFTAPTEGLIFSAAQRTSAAFDPPEQSSFAAASSFAYAPERNRAFVTNVRSDEVSACDVDEVTLLPTHCTPLPITFNQVTDIAVSPTNNALYVADNGAVKRCLFTGSSWLPTTCNQIVTRGTPLVDIRYTSFIPSGRLFFATSSDAIFRCEVAADDDFNCTRMSTPRAFSGFSKPAFNFSGTKFLLPVRSRLAICQTLDTDPNAFDCRRYGVDFDERVTSLSGFISVTGGDTAHFVVGLRRLGPAFPSTLLTCRMSLDQTSEEADACEAAIPNYVSHYPIYNVESL